jgi:hypothetical protein
MAAARADEDSADLLTFFGRADNWFDLYNRIEVAQKVAGGEPQLIGPCPTLKLKVAKASANFDRHARPTDPEKNLISFDQARDVIQALIPTVLKSRQQVSAG